MIHLFVVAGIPSPYTSYIDARVRKKIASEVGELLIVPLPRGMMTPAYDKVYRDKLLTECRRWVESRSLDDSFSVSLLYAQSESKYIHRLIGDFFPFALIQNYQPLRVVQKPNLIRKEINILVSQLAPICAELRTKSKVMLDHVTSRVRHTPLLLPPRNFDHSELHCVLRELQIEAAQSKPLERLIKALIAKFNKAVERQVISNQRHYMNADGLVFVAPRYDHFHGYVHKTEEHPASCYLSGRVRLGSSYNPKFHYDCVPFKGALKQEYRSCHLQSVSIGPKQHVNIAPNDYVRGKEQRSRNKS